MMIKRKPNGDLSDKGNLIKNQATLEGGGSKVTVVDPQGNPVSIKTRQGRRLQLLCSCMLCYYWWLYLLLPWMFAESMLISLQTRRRKNL
jgi:hypothetical protein